MDEDISEPDSPVVQSVDTPDVEEQSNDDKKLASLRTYLDSLPYACESLEEMDHKLAMIVQKMVLCSKTCHWYLLPGWDDVLQSWMLMRYPISKPNRINLVRYYYELCLIPGLDLQIIRSSVNMLTSLLKFKRGSTLVLDPSELKLDWEPLWRVLRKELIPTKTLYDPSRNMGNLLLFLAERSRRYYPVSEIPNMLNTFLPMLTKESVLTMIPVLTSFLPPSHVQDYLPCLFAIWEAFNSNVIDERLIEFMGELAEEHVAGTAGLWGEDGCRWRDVGIWTEDQWTLLMSKCLASMNVPVGASKGSNTTALHADAMGDKNALRLKKMISRPHALAKLIVYSLSVDSIIRSDANTGANTPALGAPSGQQTSGCLAGSRALDSLEKLVTSIESFFHPSNSGIWSLTLSNFLQRLCSEFCRRWKEEEDPKCRTPVTQRLTPGIRRAFVVMLRTPTLLALFAKDPISMGLAQGALRSMAFLEPGLIMPQVLERAYSGLEVVNETHRTTAVLSLLSGVAFPIVSEKVWVGGQKHLLPLLELCIPGIDLNDPTKTICAAMFICAAVQHLKIGDLSVHVQASNILVSDAPSGTEPMDVDGEGHVPEGVDGRSPSLAEERSIARDSTAGFADWVTSLFRRILALYENLPEEGGRKNTTGGKQEESVLKSIKNTLDVICLHLSDPLFDLILNLIYDYATTNTKSNAVRAIGQLVSCLARVKPDKTLQKFLPFCTRQIKEELKHGASSVRTTSTHAAIPSDTTLHWNLSIVRGCLGYGGSAVLKYKDEITELINILIERTKSERGYSSTGRLITRLLHTVSGIYPINSRFVNTEDWESADFDKNHNLYWGRLYDAKDVKIEWHVPNDEEIVFVIDVLDLICRPLLERLDSLLDSTPTWDNVARNDFCRYLYSVRSIWAGLPTLYLEERRVAIDPIRSSTDDPDENLLPTAFNVNAGFTLTNPQDPRYIKVAGCRAFYGKIIHKAAVALRAGAGGGEDHIDAIIGTTKAIDVYLLEYALTRNNFSALQKNYFLARDLNKMWPRQKENSRLVFLKRAQVYHSARLSLHAWRRRRSESDIPLFDDLVELSLSPYTRVRRQSQTVLSTVCEHYLFSRKYVIQKIVPALKRGSDPDRMKGALYVLSNKLLVSILRSEHDLLKDCILSLLSCQHQEKPSVQKLVPSILNELMTQNVSEESLRNDFSDKSLRLDAVVAELDGTTYFNHVDISQINLSMKRTCLKKQAAYDEMVSGIIEVARRPTTHWRYLQMSIRCLSSFLRRDLPANTAMARLFMEVTTKSHPTTRTLAQKSITKLLEFVKARSYAKNTDELWLEEWNSPLTTYLTINNAKEFLASISRPISREAREPETSVFVDRIATGFLVWSSTIKAYHAPDDSTNLPSYWEEASRPALSSIAETVKDDKYFQNLLSLWSQESDTRLGSNADLELRQDNISYVKNLAKIFEYTHLDAILSTLDSSLGDADRFRQRAIAEFIAGLLRGSKHWRKSAHDKLLRWFTGKVGIIFNSIKPDTQGFWESLFSRQLDGLDPRRFQPIVDWLLSLPLDFHSDSAFTISKSLSLFAGLVDFLGIRFNPHSDRFINLFFDNAHTGYAEIRAEMAATLNLMIVSQWSPSYPSVISFIAACKETKDPLSIREPRHLNRILRVAQQLPTLKQERLPPPRVNQSQYDRVSLSVLTWIWTIGHGSQASLAFPYVIPLLPEILAMTELNDDPELQMYSSAVLYVLSAITPPKEFVEQIADGFISTIISSSSWKIKLNGLPILIVFFYRNLVSFSDACVARLMEVVIACLGDENVEVREMAAKALSGLLRCSQRRRILPLRDRFIAQVKSIKLPKRQDPKYGDALRTLHSGILGLCALLESFPYSIESWMPPLTEVLAPHASDPPPISTTIRKCASEFKKTHQDTWHADQYAFDEDQLQSLSNMLIGTSYYA